MTDEQVIKIIEAVKLKPNIWDKVRNLASMLTLGLTMVYIAMQLLQLDFHRQLDDNAMVIIGLKNNNETLEDGMKHFYNKQLQYIEHCKTQATCNLPSHLAVIDPQPNYLPVAAILLPVSKQKEEEEH
jgi:hypothetical protein